MWFRRCPSVDRNLCQFESISQEAFGKANGQVYLLVADSDIIIELRSKDFDPFWLRWKLGKGEVGKR